jgi:hypothetical protein
LFHKILLVMNTNWLKSAILVISLLTTADPLICQEESAAPSILASATSLTDEMSALIAAGTSSANYGYIPKKNLYKGVTGSRFLLPYWSRGAIHMTGDKRPYSSDTVRYKFDAYANELWFWRGKDSLIMMSSKVDKVWLNDKNGAELYLRKFSKVDPKYPDKFYIELYSGGGSFFCKEQKKEFLKSNYIDKGMYHSGDPNDKFIDKNFYFVKFKDQLPVPIKLKTKSVLAAAATNVALQNKVQAYFKTNKIKNKLSELDVIYLLKYLDEEETRTTN